MEKAVKAVRSSQTEKKEDKQLNIHQRMLGVMRSVSYVQKEEKTVNGSYRFVSHDAVTAKLRPFLVEYGIVVIPRVISHSQDGNRTSVEVEIDFVNADDPQDRVTVPSFGYGIDNQDKGPGKAISYALKMAYLKTFVLETGDEADVERDLVDYKPQLISEEQLETIVDLAMEVDAHIPSFCKFLKVDDLTQLPVSDYERAMKALESKRKAMAKTAQDKAVDSETNHKVTK